MAFLYACNIDRDGGYARSWANGDASCRADRHWESKRSIRTRFLWHMGPVILPRLRAAASGPWPRDKQEASTQREEQPLRECRRLYQSNLEAAGGGNREEVRRNRTRRRACSEPAHPVLAWKRTFHPYECRNADAPAAWQDHDPLCRHV